MSNRKLNSGQYVNFAEYTNSAWASLGENSSDPESLAYMLKNGVILLEPMFVPADFGDSGEIDVVMDNPGESVEFATAEEVEDVSNYLLHKNAELYRRLAQ